MAQEYYYGERSCQPELIIIRSIFATVRPFHVKRRVREIKKYDTRDAKEAEGGFHQMGTNPFPPSYCRHHRDIMITRVIYWCYR